MRQADFFFSWHALLHLSDTRRTLTNAYFIDGTLNMRDGAHALLSCTGTLNDPMCVRFTICCQLPVFNTYSDV